MNSVTFHYTVGAMAHRNASALAGGGELGQLPHIRPSLAVSAHLLAHVFDGWMCEDSHLPQGVQICPRALSELFVQSVDNQRLNLQK